MGYLNVMRGLGKFLVLSVALGLALLAAPSRADSYDGMECSGHLVSLGETPQMVWQECGRPSYLTHHHYYYRGRHGDQDVWTYQRSGSFARVLQFNNGVLVSLAAVSQFRE